MSMENVEKVIDSLVTDSKLKEAFFNNPDEVLKNFELTSEEKDTLKNMNREEIQQFARGLGERISKKNCLQ
jgi:hypothetical protein